MLPEPIASRRRSYCLTCPGRTCGTQPGGGKRGGHQWDPKMGEGGTSVGPQNGGGTSVGPQNGGQNGGASVGPQNGGRASVGPQNGGGGHQRDPTGNPDPHPHPITPLNTPKIPQSPPQPLPISHDSSPHPITLPHQNPTTPPRLP